MCKCCEHCVNSYLQNQELEHEEKQENECLALPRSNNLLYKNLLHSSREEGFDKLINLPFSYPSTSPAQILLLSEAVPASDIVGSVEHTTFMGSDAFSRT